MQANKLLLEWIKKNLKVATASVFHQNNLFFPLVIELRRIAEGIEVDQLPALLGHSKILTTQKNLRLVYHRWEDVI